MRESPKRYLESMKRRWAQMTQVSVKDLKRKASAVVARVAAGGSVTVTMSATPAARIAPIAASPLQQLIGDGQARRARRSLADIPAPQPGPRISDVLQQMRYEERY